MLPSEYSYWHGRRPEYVRFVDEHHFLAVIAFAHDDIAVGVFCEQFGKPFAIVFGDIDNSGDFLPV